MISFKHNEFGQVRIDLRAMTIRDGLNTAKMRRLFAEDKENENESERLLIFHQFAFLYNCSTIYFNEELIDLSFENYLSLPEKVLQKWYEKALVLNPQQGPINLEELKKRIEELTSSS